MLQFGAVRSSSRAVVIKQDYGMVPLEPSKFYPIQRIPLVKMNQQFIVSHQLRSHWINQNFIEFHLGFQQFWSRIPSMVRWFRRLNALEMRVTTGSSAQAWLKISELHQLRCWCVMIRDIMRIVFECWRYILLHDDSSCKTFCILLLDDA